MNNSEFLSLLEFPKNSGRFVLGPFDPGITLLRQQTRAINLLYALSDSGRLQAGAKIAIIGGGVSGLTAATAAAKLNCSVTLIERLHTLVHLQQGCDTRWLHPHIYDWPAAGSQRKYAGLPFLDWHASSASSVAKQISNTFWKIVESGKKIDVYLGSNVQSVKNTSSGSKKQISICWNSANPVANRERKFDFVIFAVGFGVERNVSHSWPSYWRNDSIHQTNPLLEPEQKSSFLISGTGDGGLIDLMRATISDFSHSSIHDELFRSSHEELLVKLNEIKNCWNEGRIDSEDNWLFQRYDELEQEGLLEPVMAIIKKRLRPDTKVVLNGTAQDFSSSLRLNSASLFSTLIAFCLMLTKGFEYLPGKLTIAGDEVKIDDSVVKYDQILLRHGADTMRTYLNAKCDGITSLFSSSEALRQYFNTAERLWPAGWWGKESVGVEPVSPPTLSLATTFVSTLRDMVALALGAPTGLAVEDQSTFRMTMHRLIAVRGQFFYQQIARYAGSQGHLQGTVGRVFDVNRGLGGLCCRLGKPVILRKGDGFEDLQENLELQLTPARPIASGTESFLSVPFFSHSSHGSDATPSIVLLLYVDSNREDFFSDTILRAIYTACRGFVNNLEAMLGHGEISLSTPDFQQYTPQLNPNDKELLGKYSSIISTDHDIFSGYSSQLTFKSVKFFEII